MRVNWSIRSYHDWGHIEWKRYQELLQEDPWLLLFIQSYIRECELGRAYLPNLASNLAFSNSHVTQGIRARVNRFARRLDDLGYFEMWSADHSAESQYRVWNTGKTRDRPFDCYIHEVLWPKYTVDIATRAVAMIEVENEKAGIGAGTAVHIGDNRFVSCAHCFEQIISASLIRGVGTNHEVKTAIDLEKVTIAKEYDSAWFRLETGPKEEFPIGFVGYASPTDEVLVVHFPTIAKRSPTMMFSLGEVNARMEDYKDQQTYLAISAKTAPGSSGGAVINKQGELVGVITEQTRIESESSGFVNEPFYFALDATMVHAHLVDQEYRNRQARG